MGRREPDGMYIHRCIFVRIGLAVALYGGCITSLEEADSLSDAEHGVNNGECD